MISDQVESRGRHERSELFYELQRFKNDVRRSIAPAALETAKPLQAHAVPCGNRDVGVDVDARYGGAAGTGKDFRSLHVDLIAHRRNTHAGSRSGSGAPGH